MEAQPAAGAPPAVEVAAAPAAAPAAGAPLALLDAPPAVAAAPAAEPPPAAPSADLLRARRVQHFEGAPPPPVGAPAPVEVPAPEGAPEAVGAPAPVRALRQLRQGASAPAAPVRPPPAPQELEEHRLWDHNIHQWERRQRHAAAVVPAVRDIPAAPVGARNGADLTHGFADFNQVTCWKCGLAVDALRVRSRGKNERKFKCFECNTVMTQLHRIHGSWPPSDFLTLDPKKQEEFYASMKLCLGNKAALAAASTQYLQKFKVTKQVFADNGEFLPLSVWSTRGFCAAAIERNSAAADKQTHPVLGLVYRVAIVSSGTQGEEGYQQRSEATASNGRGGRGSARARDDSSQSSRSRERREKKKAKKGEAREKEKEKERLQREKVRDAANKKKVKVAEATIEKLQEPCRLMKENQEQRRCADLPRLVRHQASGALVECEAVIEQAEKVLEDPTLPFDYEAAAVAKLLKKARKLDGTITSLLTTFTRVEAALASSGDE